MSAAMIREFTEKTGISPAVIAQVLGVTPRTVEFWLLNDTKPGADLTASFKRLQTDPNPKFSPSIPPNVVKEFLAARQHTLDRNGVGFLPSGRKSYPLKRMAVGEKIFVPADNRSVEETNDSLTSCIRNCRLRTGFKFSTHRTETGVEVKRIK